MNGQLTSEAGGVGAPRTLPKDERASARFRRAIRRAYRAYLKLVGRLRTSRMIHRWLFGYRPCPGSEATGAYWDWVTVALRRALDRHLRSGMAVLDMGTGPVAVLAVYAARRRNCRVARAVDHVREVVYCARRNIAHQGLAIDACISDLFENVSRRYDLICFNPPYVDSDRDATADVIASDIAERRFSGGPSGGRTIAHFLADAPRYLTPGGIILIGVNHYHVRRPTMRGLIRASGLSIQSEIGNPLTGARVYALHHGPTSRCINPVPAKPPTARQPRSQTTKTSYRCRTCVMPACVPGSDFDSSGQCFWCRSGFPDYRPAGEDALRAHLYANRSAGAAADCLVAVSGGKDSCYALAYVCRQLGLRAEAYTYVHDGLTGFSLDNARALCAALGVRHHVVELPNHEHLKSFKAFLAAWMGSFSPLAAAMTCAACKHLFPLGSALAAERGIPNVISAACPLEVPPFIPTQSAHTADTRGRGMAGMVWSLLKELCRQSKFAAAFFRHAPTCIKGCLTFNGSSRYLRLRFPGVNHVSFFEYVPWDEQRIISEVRQVIDWSTPESVQVEWHSDCLFNCFKEYMFQKMLGASYTDAFVSNRIRHGLITRQQGMAELKASKAFFAAELLNVLPELGLTHLADRVNVSCFHA